MSAFSVHATFLADVTSCFPVVWWYCRGAVYSQSQSLRDTDSVIQYRESEDQLNMT